MALADDLKDILYTVRAIPGQLGLRPHSVTLLQRSYSGAHTGLGTMSEVGTPVVEADGQNPKVRSLKGDEIALGQLDAGSIEIGPITPTNTLGGLNLASLSSLTRGQVLHIRIIGPMHPDGAVYRLVSVTADRAMHYKITASPAGTE